jgi:hypothetical protein
MKLLCLFVQASMYAQAKRCQLTVKSVHFSLITNPYYFIVKTHGLYSQHFIFFLTYEWAQ